ncbi:S-adenosylmethionine decarboxylase [Botrimarina hoheduenensis]|uniref:S-adenosylmethionine decarboxylase proenzyme n=1 Tax=Botrimarina hoheduenensis TaxID=2528000 RepID=A0A5C5WDY9_9BACT|nr:S-adenosylmethionine decarboxylase [Botrimarina hoheduenensis]TWT48279.1 S-adenosylmethionine decarboxylase proenzyme [Botrimarina hoheduenensis]
MTQALTEYRRLQHNGEPHYGQHLIATALSCNEGILSIERLYDFLQRLADDIDMVRYGPPIVARFGEGHEVGISGVQLIQTSSITIHTNDAHRDMYLDVFSCKSFAEETVRSVVEEFLSPTSLSCEVFFRK